MFSRRALLRQLLVLGAGLGAAWWVRTRYVFPKPGVVFAGGAAATPWTSLPDPAGLIELTARVNGVPIRAVVDSGAQFSAIDRRLAARLGLAEEILPLLAFGVSGEPRLTHTVSLDLSLPGLELRGMRAATLELVPLSGAMHRPFAMLLGRDVLQAVCADVDWPAGRVRFVRPDGFAPPPGAQLAPTRLANGALMTAVRVEGLPPTEVMIDTGATSELAVSEKTALQLGLLSGRVVTSGRSVSLGGLSRDRVVQAQSLLFAGRRIPDVEVQVFTPTASAPVPAGLLGVGVLRRYRVGLDLGRGQLWLTPPSAQPPPRRRVRAETRLQTR